MSRCKRGDVDIVAAGGPGAATAAVTVEFLAALGVRRIVLVGVAGGLEPVRPPGTLVVADRAVGDDGTSARYPKPSRSSAPLASALAAAVGPNPAIAADLVTTVTTDVPLRHTWSDIERFRAEADVIEMEAAALFAAASHRHIEAGCVLAISDCYGDHQWSRGDDATVLAALRSAVSAAADVLVAHR